VRPGVFSLYVRITLEFLEQRIYTSWGEDRRSSYWKVWCQRKSLERNSASNVYKLGVMSQQVWGGYLLIFFAYEMNYNSLWYSRH